LRLQVKESLARRFSWFNVQAYMRDVPPYPRIPRAVTAFTLVEIAVVVTLLGLLVAMALPAYRHVTIGSKAAAVTNDVRVFATAFQTYSTQKGGWPPSAATGVIPPEIADAMSSSFARPTPIGGHYEWDFNSSANGFHITAAICIVSSSGTPMSDDMELLEKVDQLYDDGDLTKGNVQLGATNNLVFIIEP
jgi:type II secretory pathway pseudopilin PulG